MLFTKYLVKNKNVMIPLKQKRILFVTIVVLWVQCVHFGGVKHLLFSIKKYQYFYLCSAILKHYS